MGHGDGGRRWYSSLPYCRYSRSRMRRVAGPLKFSCAASTVASSSSQPEYSAAAHENLSGPATRRILEREYRQYGKLEYQRLAAISVAHLYNLTETVTLSGTPSSLRQTRPTTVAIGNGGDPIHKAGPGLSAGRHRAPR